MERYGLCAGKGGAHLVETSEWSAKKQMLSLPVDLLLVTESNSLSLMRQPVEYFFRYWYTSTVYFFIDILYYHWNMGRSNWP